MPVATAPGTDFIGQCSVVNEKAPDANCLANSSGESWLLHRIFGEEKLFLVIVFESLRNPRNFKIRDPYHTEILDYGSNER